MSIAYLDSSVILRRLLRDPHAWIHWHVWQRCYTSEIARLECLRMLDRRRLQGMLTDVEIAKMIRWLGEFFESLDCIRLTPAVLQRASQSFPTVVGTLDAIHLASAILLKENSKAPLIFLTHDVQQGLAAQAIGFDCRGFSLAQA